jgi:hypothetical protein
MYSSFSFIFFWSYVEIIKPRLPKTPGVLAHDVNKLKIAGPGHRLFLLGAGYFHIPQAQSNT